MARKSTGGIVEKQTTRGASFGIRFRALSRRQFVHIGYAADGVTRADAERELAYTLEQVRRGEWQPPAEIEAPREVPTFHVAASEWFAAKQEEGGRRGRGLSEKAVVDLRWRLEVHLLPTFAKKRLDAITVEDVDRWRRAKVREGRIGAGSINKCLTTLGAILEVAVEYGHIDRNPAVGKRRRLPAPPPRRTWLDRAAHIAALLDAAGELDDEARSRKGQRRALIATLVLGGLRIGEMLDLKWGDVDLARGTLRVGRAKTHAGERTVYLLALLRDELLAYRASLGDVRPQQRVFGSATGNRQSESNVRNRVLAKAVEKANERLERGDEAPIAVKLTPHSLRRTFASLLYALGEAPPYVMRQMGHTSPSLALAVYAREMDRRDGEPERLRALVEGRDWAPTGTSGVETTAAAAEKAAA
jgi:integrase